MRLSRALQGYWLTKELDFSENTVPGYRRTFGQQKHPPALRPPRFAPSLIRHSAYDMLESRSRYLVASKPMKGAHPGGPFHHSHNAVSSQALQP